MKEEGHPFECVSYEETDLSRVLEASSMKLSQMDGLMRRRDVSLTRKRVLVLQVIRRVEIALAIEYFRSSLSLGDVSMDEEDEEDEEYWLEHMSRTSSDIAEESGMFDPTNLSPQSLVDLFNEDPSPPVSPIGSETSLLSQVPLAVCVPSNAPLPSSPSELRIKNQSKQHPLSLADLSPPKTPVKSIPISFDSQQQAFGYLQKDHELTATRNDTSSNDSTNQQALGVFLLNARRGPKRKSEDTGTDCSPCAKRSTIHGSSASSSSLLVTF